MNAADDPQFPGFTNYVLRVPAHGEQSLELVLRRSNAARSSSSAVLILHGGNSSGLTYTAPNGGLAKYLGRKGVDVWLLEWRASPFVVDPLLERPPLGGSVSAERALFNLDLAAAEDVPRALAYIRSAIGKGPSLALMGHCLSGAVVSMAVARGLVEDFGVSSVILSTLGLFVEAPWNGWLKAEDFILERILHNAPLCRGINPKQSERWPNDMKAGYDGWPGAWLPKNVPTWLRALSFMVGQPYSPERVHPELRAADTDRYFGTMHLGIYVHTGQLVRRGFCAALGAPDVIDRSRLHQLSDEPSPATRADLDPQYFRNKHVALIAATDNRVWHRDAIDLMYEWLRNNECHDVKKSVFAGYNLQELIWGLRAPVDVYPSIVEAIQQRSTLGLPNEAAE